MTDLNSFNHVDNYDDVLATHVNELIPGSLVSKFKNIEVLAATRTLLDIDTPIQRLNCNGANRDVKCPTPNAVTNHPYWLVNSSAGAYSLVVKSNDGTTTLTTIAQGGAALIAPDGNGLYLPVGVDDLSLYLLKSGLTEWDQQSGDPSTPASSKWKLYFKSGGLYYKDSAGTVVGPLGAGGGGGDAINYLYNPGFAFAQKQAPGTLTTIADGGISADGWRVTRANADVQYQRNDATGETGLKSTNYGRFKKITNSGKMLIYQIIEGAKAVPLRGQTVIFPIKIRCETSRTLRVAVLELQSGGTMNTIPAALVTAFNADGSDPTLASNVAIITAAQSKSITTSWTEFSVSVTAPSTSKNLIVAVWSDSAMAVNGYIDLAEARFGVGSTIPTWSQRDPQIELALCQRWIEKNVDVDQAPVDNYGGSEQLVAFALGTVNAYGITPFKVTKFKVPSSVTYFNAGATAGKWKYIVTAGSPVEGTVATNAVTTTQLSMYVAGTYTTNLGLFLQGGWLVDVSL